MVTLLLALGVWQLERLAWKRGLLAEIATAERSPPAPLGRSVPPLFTRVAVHGVLRPQAALYGADVRGEGAAMRMGAQLIEIMDRSGASPVLVDLGWIPTPRGSQIQPVGGPAKLVAYVRLPERPGWLSAPDDLEGRHFYSLDPTAIGASLGAADVAPFTLVALGAQAGDGPIPASGLPVPVNNHLSYALTWFGLAGTLIVIFTIWATKKATTSRPKL
jgi:surfeit locus 1 family protein